MDFSATAEKLIRTAPQIRSQGACGAFYWGNCKPIAGSHAAETVGKTSSYLPRRPLPRHGGGVGGAEPSAASGGCSEAEHPQRSKKSSKRVARRFFRAPQGGGGRCCRRLPLERICAQYGFGFFAPEKTKFVASKAKRQRGLSRGNSSPLTRFCLLLAAQKEAPAG